MADEPRVAVGTRYRIECRAKHWNDYKWDSIELPRKYPDKESAIKEITSAMVEDRMDTDDSLGLWDYRIIEIVETQIDYYPSDVSAQEGAK